MRTAIILPIVAAIAMPLVAGSREPAPEMPSPLIIRSASYVGDLKPDQAEFSARYDIEMVNKTGEARVVLVSGPVALSKVRSSSDSVQVIRDGDKVIAVVRARGKYQVTATLVVSVQETQDIWKTLSFNVGPALVSRIEATADGEDSKIELLAGTTESTSHSNGRTTLAGYSGSAGAIQLRYQAKVKEKSVKPVVLCEVQQLFEISPAVLKVVAGLQYDVPQGETRSFEVHIPASLTVMKVSGQGVRDWSLEKTNNLQICKVELLKPVSGRYVLEIQAEQPVPQLPTRLSLPEIRPGSVDRESGSLGLLSSEVTAEVTDLKGLSRINNAAFSTVDVAQTLQCAFRYSQPGYTCGLSVVALQPKVTTTHSVSVQVGERRVQFTDAISLSVERAGIFAIAIDLPQGFTVTDVKGAGIEDWKVADAGNRRSLNITLSRKILGAYVATVAMEQAYDKLPDALRISGLRVPGTDTETGIVSFSPAAGIVLREGESTGATSADIRALSSRTGSETLAFTFRNSDWSIGIKTEALKPRVTAQVFNLVTLGDGFIGGSATINYTIENAGVNEFMLDIPAAWKNVDITGVDIREKSRTGNVWTVVLQDRVLGSYALVVTYDQQFDPNSATLDPSGLKTVGTDQESGNIAITSGSHLEISEADGTKGLKRIDARELEHRHLALIENPILRVYSYLQQPCQLRLKTGRNTVQKPLDAVADHAMLVTVVTRAGRRETQATYHVKNNMKDNLRLVLPGKSKLLTTFVDGNAVKPEIDNGAVIVPLKKSENRDRAYPVEVTYVEEGKPLSRWFWSSIDLEAPVTEINSTYMGWNVYLPAWVKMGESRGSMHPFQSYSTDSEIVRAVATYEYLFTAGKEIIVTLVVVILILGGLISAVVLKKVRLVPLIIMFAVFGLIAALISPAFMKARSNARRSACANNLRLIESAKDNYAIDYGGTNGMQLNWGNLSLYIKDLDNKCFCPQALTSARGPGNYQLGALGEAPQCLVCGSSLHGDKSPVQGHAAASAPVPRLPAGQPMVMAGESRTAGLLPIRIEIPKQGKVWQFSRVLNSVNEPLTVKAGLVPVETGRFLAYSLCVILLLLALRAFTKAASAGSVIQYTTGVAEILVAVAVFLHVHEGFHLFLVGLPPAVAVAFLVGLVRGRRKQPVIDDEDVETIEPGPASPPPVSPAAGAIALLLGMSLFAPQARGEGTSVPPPSLQAMIVSAEYDGTIAGNVGQFTAALDVVVPAPMGEDGRPSRRYLPCQSQFLGRDIALRDVKISGSDARLLPCDSGFTLYLPKPGKYKVTFSFLANVEGDAARKRLRFGIIPSAASVVRCLIDEKEATVESASAVAVRRDFRPEGTLATLFPGAQGNVDLTWIPRVKRAGEVQVSAFCKAASLAQVGEGAVRLSSGFQYEVSQGEMLTARIFLPAELRLLKVSGGKVLNWELKAKPDGQELTVDMKTAVSASDVLLVESELPLPQLPASVTLRIPHALGVQREIGHLAIAAAEEIGSVIGDTVNLQRIDPSEFPSQLATGGAAPAPQRSKGAIRSLPEHAFRHTEADARMSLAISRMQPELKVTVAELVTIGENETLVRAALSYEIRKAGIFEVDILLPAGYDVEGVTAPSLKQWIDDKKSAERTLRVIFSEKMRGNYTVKLTLRQRGEKFTGSTAVPAVSPVGVLESSGTIAVGTSFGIALAKADASGLAEIPVSELADRWEDAVLAFKFRKTGWSLVVRSNLSESWVQVEGTHVLRISENTIKARTDFSYTIQNAPIDRLVVSVPVGARNVNITGGNIRQRDNEGAKWTVVLQSKTSRSYKLSVSFDMQLPAGARELAMPFAQTVGTEREQGFVLVCSEASLHLKELKRSDQVLLPVDTRDLPAGTRNEAGDQVRLAYRYLRQNQELTVAIERYKAAEVLQAIIQKARLTTVVAEDGALITRATLTVRNNTKQNLELRLPAASEIWSCFVADEAVLATIKDGKLLLPLLQTGEDEPYDLELTYVTKTAPLKKGRKMLFSAPELDLPMHDAQWDINVPSEYHYGWFGGTAERIQQAEMKSKEFSLADYEYDAWQGLTRRKRKAIEFVKKAEASARQGDVATARRQFKSSLQNYANAEAASQMIQLEADEALANAVVDNRMAVTNTAAIGIRETGADQQGQDFSKVIIGINSFRGNAGNQAAADPFAQQQVPAEAQEQAPVIEGKFVRVAKEQAKKIRETQVVSAARVTPLRISIPIRGIQYSFTQALWMPGDRPMSVEMKAGRIGSIGWGRLIGVTFFGLIFLAVFVGGLVRRSRLQIFIGAVLIGLLYSAVMFL